MFVSVDELYGMRKNGGLLQHSSNNKSWKQCNKNISHSITLVGSYNGLLGSPIPFISITHTTSVFWPTFISAMLQGLYRSLTYDLYKTNQCIYPAEKRDRSAGNLLPTFSSFPPSPTLAVVLQAPISKPRN